MKKILIITGRYIPGYKDGGPVRTIKNLTDFFGEKYDFYILTRDRDHGDKEPYSTVKINEWNKIGKAKVYYASDNNYSLRTIKRFANDMDLIYVCGCFSDYSIKVMFLKYFKLINKPVVFASMGLFSPNAFRLKYKKKKMFITILNIFRVFKNIYWSVSSEFEKNDVMNYIKTTEDKIFIAEDLPRKIEDVRVIKNKENNTLKIVWFSRITPKKNLLGTIEILELVKDKIEFDIYGPIYDEEYWNVCQKHLRKLSKNIKWEYKGILNSEEVVEKLRDYHIFLFQTLGENYGHVIQEALSAGCPCILSNTTPWKDLEKYGAGFVFELNEIESFAKVISFYANMDKVKFQEQVDNTLEYVNYKYQEQIKQNGYINIFEMGN